MQRVSRLLPCAQSLLAACSLRTIETCHRPISTLAYHNASTQHTGDSQGEWCIESNSNAETRWGGRMGARFYGVTLYGLDDEAKRTDTQEEEDQEWADFVSSVRPVKRGHSLPKCIRPYRNCGKKTQTRVLNEHRAKLRRKRKFRKRREAIDRMLADFMAASESSPVQPTSTEHTD